MFKHSSSTLSLCIALLLVFSITFQGFARATGMIVSAKTANVEKSPSTDVKEESATAAPQPAPTPQPQKTPPPLVPQAAAITAFLRDSFPDHTNGGKAIQGDTINYSVNIVNTGDANATSVNFTDTVDPNTSTLVGGSPQVLFTVTADSYSAIGNMSLDTSTIAPGSGQTVLENDAGANGATLSGFGATVATANGTVPNGTNAVTTSNGGTVKMNANGSFIFTPAAGFGGAGVSDTFWYTLTKSGVGTGFPTGSPSGSARVTINVSAPIWFIDQAAAGGGNGTLTTPFNCLTGAGCFSAVNDGVGSHPKAGDFIFMYKSSGAPAAFTGGVTLLNNQKLIGEGASASLATITGTSVPSGGAAYPSTGNAPPAVTTAVAGTNGINLAVGASATLRGFNIGNTTGFKIASGANFGTLTTSEMALSGTGGDLSLTSGALAATFTSTASTSSGSQGISLSSITGNLTTGGTTISGNTTQCILVSGSTVTADFGSTSCTGGSDGVSLQNNSANTRTFGTLNVSGGTGNAFLHGAAGGNATISGAATLSSAGSAVSVSSPGGTNVINFQSSVSATSTGSGNAAVNWVGTAGATLTFNSLSTTANAGTGLNATTGGTVNVTNGTGTINGTTAAAIVANAVALNANFSAINASGGTNGVSLTSVTGTSNFGGGTLSGASGATFLVSGGTVSTTFTGGITQANNAATVSVAAGHSGTLTFNTGTLSATNGTGLQFDNADGTYNFNGTNSLNGGDAGIDIQNGSAGTFSFSSNTAITSPTGIAYNEDTSTAAVTYNGTITQNNAASAVKINAKTGGTTAFSGTITASTSTAGAINLTNNTGGTINFTNTLGLTTTSGVAFNATGGGTIKSTATASTLTSTTGTALNVVSTTIGTGGLVFTSINAGTAASGPTNGIVLNTTGNTAGLTVSGTGTTAGSGGTIQKTVQGALFTSTINLSLSNMNFTNADSGNGTVNNVDTSGFNSAAQAAINMSSVTTASFTNLSVTGGGGSGGAQVGINGQNVSAFTLANSTVSGFGDAAQEGDVKLWNLTGTCSVSNSNFSFQTGDTTGGENLFEVRNSTASSLTLTVSDSNFTNTRDSTSGSGGLAVTSTSSGTVNLNVYHNSFLNLKTSGVETFAKMTSTLNVNITDGGVGGNGNTFDPQNTTNGGRAIGINSQDTAHTNFNINRNPKIWGSAGPIINIYGQNASVTNGHILNNTDIRNNSTAASPVGSPIYIHPQDNATGFVEVGSNTIINKNDPGIYCNVVGDGISSFSAALDVEIKSNNITTNGSNTFGIELASGASNSDATNIYAYVHNNAVTLGGSGNLAFGILSGGGSSEHVYLQNFTSNGQTTWNNNSNTPANSYAELINITSPAAIPAGHNGGTVIPPSNATAKFINPFAQPNQQEIAQLNPGFNGASVEAEGQVGESVADTHVAQTSISGGAGTNAGAGIAKISSSPTIANSTISGNTTGGGSSSLLTISSWQNQPMPSTAAFNGSLAFLQVSDLSTRAAITTESPSTEASTSPATIAAAGASGQSKQLAPISARLKQVLHPVASFAAELNFLQRTEAPVTGSHFLSLIPASIPAGDELNSRGRRPRIDAPNKVTDPVRVELVRPLQGREAFTNRSPVALPPAIESHAFGVKERGSRPRVSADDKPVTPQSGGTVNLSVGTITPGSSAVVNFTVTVNNSAPAGANTISNQGSVTSSAPTVSTDDPDTVPANDATVTPLIHPSAANGNVSGQIVDSDGKPVEGAVIRLQGTQTRKTITDSNGVYNFAEVETNGFYTVTPSRVNYNFAPSARGFSALGAHTEASFSATANGNHENPLDTTEYFVRQQYVDFLGREPEEKGFNDWTDTINNCALNDESCDRVHVSESFFRSEEFQQRGYFVYRFYSTAFGQKPDYAAFAPDLARVSGFLTTDQLEAAKTQFANDFVNRPAFASQYGTLSNAHYVDALSQTAGVTLANRQTLVDSLDAGTLTRAQALRQIAESGEVYQRYYNQAFVVMEYFGYLRRDPDALYLNWIDVLNANPADSRHMVEGFVDATEYRNRFKQ